jgi:hypothetical protein
MLLPAELEGLVLSVLLLSELLSRLAKAAMVCFRTRSACQQKKHNTNSAQ